ncbi:MAG TPA: hypothetical protein VFI06_03975, partial [Chitinophagaceae bacterium]|nr:hypothetical protein [Chitinophagaceae bacterium]
MKKSLCLFPLVIFACILTNTASNAQSPAIDASKIKFSRSISNEVSTFYFNSEVDLSNFYARASFKEGVIHKKNIPNEYVTMIAALRFRLYNSADSAVKICFFPGLYYRYIKLYREENNHLQELPSELPPVRDSIGYRLITLAPHDSQTLVAELGFIKTYINTMRPRLINPEYLNSYITGMQSATRENDLVTFLFCGLLLMMVLFSIANFVQGGNREFLYYSGYAFFLGIMLLTKAVFTGHSNHISYFLEAYLDFIL